jgi:hypothetical protein
MFNVIRGFYLKLFSFKKEEEGAQNEPLIDPQ